MPGNSVMPFVPKKLLKKNENPQAGGRISMKKYDDKECSSVLCNSKGTWWLCGHYYCLSHLLDRIGINPDIKPYMVMVKMTEVKELFESIKRLAKLKPS